MVDIANSELESTDCQHACFKHAYIRLQTATPSPSAISIEQPPHLQIHVTPCPSHPGIVNNQPPEKNWPDHEISCSLQLLAAIPLLHSLRITYKLIRESTVATASACHIRDIDPPINQTPAEEGSPQTVPSCTLVFHLPANCSCPFCILPTSSRYFYKHQQDYGEAHGGGG